MSVGKSEKRAAFSLKMMEGDENVFSGFLLNVGMTTRTVFTILLWTHQIYSFLSRLCSKLWSVQILSVGHIYLPLDSKQLKQIRILIFVRIGHVRACLYVRSMYISCFSKYWSWGYKILWYWRGKQFCLGRRACACSPDIFDFPLPVLVLSRLWPC